MYFGVSCRLSGGEVDWGAASAADVNECLETPTICGPAGACSNVPGSYRCVCPEGYRLDATGLLCQHEPLDYDQYDCPADYCDDDTPQNCQVGRPSGAGGRGQSIPAPSVGTAWRRWLTWCGTGHICLAEFSSHACVRPPLS